MKNLIECKEYYKDLYMDCLENNSFEKNIFESTEKSRYETFCETLRFIYGVDFENIMLNWANDAAKEFYSKKQLKKPDLFLLFVVPSMVILPGSIPAGGLFGIPWLYAAR